MRMKKPTQKEELKIYRDLLIHLHTCRWTHHNDDVIKILDRIGEYSYARTNSNEGNDRYERRHQIQTLLNLKLDNLMEKNN